MHRKTSLVLLGVAVLATAAAFAGWRFVRPQPVELARVESGSVPAYVTGPGTVQARVPVTVSARLTSTIVEVNVDVGDTVRPGQLLASLDARDLAARHSVVRGQQESIARQVEAADAAVEKARADLALAVARERRDADLHATGFVSVASLDTSRAAAQAAQAALVGAQATVAARRADQGALRHEASFAQTQVGHARLLAPMAGVVTQRLVEPGTTVAPGTPILRLVDPRTLWVATRVDEALVERVRPGQPATLRLRSGTTVRGSVARVAMQSDAATRELDVHVAFAEPPVRVAIDQEAEVRIEVGQEHGELVPLAALTRDAAGRRGVLRVDGGRASFVPVETGAESGGRVVVRGGLRAGDLVVAQADRVRAGARVRALQR